MKKVIFGIFTLATLCFYSCSNNDNDVLKYKTVTDTIYATEKIVEDYTFYLPFDNSLFEKLSSESPIANSPLTFTSDRNGIAKNAAYFDGSQVLKYNGTEAVNLFGHFTISCWLKPDKEYGFTSSDLQNEIQLFGRFTGAAENISSYALNFLNDGRISIRTCNIGLKSNFYTTNQIIETGKWTHIAVTYNGEIFKIFINGKLEFSQNSYNFAQSANVEFCVGARNFPNIAVNRFYKGALDEVKIYRRAINSLELKELAK